MRKIYIILSILLFPFIINGQGVDTLKNEYTKLEKLSHLQQLKIELLEQQNSSKDVVIDNQSSIILWQEEQLLECNKTQDLISGISTPKWYNNKWVYFTGGVILTAAAILTTQRMLDK